MFGRRKYHELLRAVRFHVEEWRVRRIGDYSDFDLRLQNEALDDRAPISPKRNVNKRVILFENRAASEGRRDTDGPEVPPTTNNPVLRREGRKSDFRPSVAILSRISRTSVCNNKPSLVSSMPLPVFL